MYALGKYTYTVTTLSLLITKQTCTKGKAANLNRKKCENSNDAGGSLIKEYSLK